MKGKWVYSERVGFLDEKWRGVANGDPIVFKRLQNKSAQSPLCLLQYPQLPGIGRIIWKNVTSDPNPTLLLKKGDFQELRLDDRSCYVVYRKLESPLRGSMILGVEQLSIVLSVCIDGWLSNVPRTLKALCAPLHECRTQNIPVSRLFVFEDLNDGTSFPSSDAPYAAFGDCCFEPYCMSASLLWPPAPRSLMISGQKLEATTEEKKSGKLTFQKPRRKTNANISIPASLSLILHHPWNSARLQLLQSLQYPIL